MKIFAVVNLQNLNFYVSSTLSVVCQKAGLSYSTLVKKMGEEDRVTVKKGNNILVVFKAVVDRSASRGGAKNFKGGKGMRGYKGNDGLLHQTSEKKVLMGSKEEQEILRRLAERQEGF